MPSGSYKAVAQSHLKSVSPVRKSPSHPISIIMLLLSLAFAAMAVAQNASTSLTPATTTAFDAGVPTDAPIPG